MEKTFENTSFFVLQDSRLTLSWPYPTLLLSADEGKTLTQLERIWQFLIDHHATRSSCLYCVGGGTITDLGGLAAATYMRGIDYINVPSTLLGMVDAAVGGKCGIDYRGLKNVVGAIRQPLRTELRMDLLDTLPREQLLSGCAELLKTAILSDEQFYQDVLCALEDMVWTSALPVSLESLVRRAMAYKQQLVARDPEDLAERHALNLGHTVGHALEEMSGLSHGYCVLYGLVAELYMSVALCGLDREVLSRLSHVMTEYYGRPQCTCSDMDRLISLMHRDKKNPSNLQSSIFNLQSSINFTLLPSIGHPLIDQYPPLPLIRESLDYLFSL